MQKIQKITNGEFKIFWEESPNEIINLDFNPLLNVFGLRNKTYVLLHWQAIPIGLRRFGIYDCLQDQYTGVDYDKISFQNTQCTLAQLPDFYSQKRPTAVIVYKGVVTYQNNGVIVVKNR